MNWNELEREFAAEGWGNGSLHPYVVHDPTNYWEGGRHKDDFYVGFDLHWGDWEALFWDALNASRRDEYVQGTDIGEFHERNRRQFQESISGYPLLGRIFDMYEDATYKAEEVNQLRNECLKVRDGTDHAGAIRALNKLILACRKASQGSLGLLLLSD